MVAICEIGKTVLVEDEKQRCTEGMERAVVARGKVMGKYLTQIKRVEYLNKPQWAAGRYGVYEQEINLDSIPVGWDIVQELFASYDTDGNGTIDLDEFKSMAAKLNIAPQKKNPDVEKGKESNNINIEGF